ncbi:MAG TPA: alpha/beta hydrolase [Candidatus Limnocylindrales bacterium]|jgi:pimeloyl-ACP methyl ester carboxylesterase
MPPDPAAALEPWAPDVALAPPPDTTRVPDGFVVAADDGSRLHFLDWRGPSGEGWGARPAASPARPGVLLLPGLLQPAWSWAPVARRLAAVSRVVVADLRGQGLSDAPMTSYDPATLAGDAVAVAEGSGLLASGPIVVAGHGFGGIVATATGVALGERCAGIVLADGGWERLEVTTDTDVEEFLRGLDEPPEVLRTIDAYLADRRGFDPATWDADQERAARDAVVETAAGHVVRAVRPHVVESIVREMFGWDPALGLAAVEAPVAVLVALGAGDPDARLAELRRTATARAAAGRSPIRITGFAGIAHNLMRYRPADVTAAILGAG